MDPALIAAEQRARHPHGRAPHRPRARRASSFNALYDAWTPGPRLPSHPRRRAHPHGVRVGAPGDARRGEVRGPRAGTSATTPSVASWNFPAPWPGGTWRLRDIVDYQMSASRALLEHAARNRDFWLRTFLRREPAGREPRSDPSRSCSRRAEGSAGRGAAAAGPARRAASRCIAPGRRSKPGADASRAGATVVLHGAALQRVREVAARAPALSRHARSTRAGRPSGPTTSPPTRCRCSWASTW